MPHILDYCGAMSLANLSTVSRSMNKTIEPLLSRKKNAFPIAVEINDILMPGTTEILCNVADRVVMKITFDVVYKISLETHIIDNTFFRIYTPFGIWGIDVNFRDYISPDYMNGFTDQLDVYDDVREAFSSQDELSYKKNNIFYYDICSKNNTCIRVLFRVCYGTGTGMNIIHGHDITGICIVGAVLIRTDSATVLRRGMYLFGAACLLWGALCGPTTSISVAAISAAIFYTMVCFARYCNDSSHYVERREDW